MPIYKVTCKLGDRNYIEKFATMGNAREFIEKMVETRKGKPKWESSTCMIVKDVTITSESLEDIMESEQQGKTYEGMFKRIPDFLEGKGIWSKTGASPLEEEEEKEKRKKKKSGDGDDVQSLADICKRNGWDERRARMRLRASGEKKTGRWAWTSDRVPDVEKKLRQLMK
jgi:hypothetical protein